jgi:hypothetical protein
MCVCVCVSDVCGTRVAVMGKGEREGSNEGVKQQEQGGEWLCSAPLPTATVVVLLIDYARFSSSSASRSESFRTSVSGYSFALPACCQSINERR